MCVPQLAGNDGALQLSVDGCWALPPCATNTAEWPSGPKKRLLSRRMTGLAEQLVWRRNYALQISKFLSPCCLLPLCMPGAPAADQQPCIVQLFQARLMYACHGGAVNSRSVGTVRVHRLPLAAHVWFCHCSHASGPAVHSAASSVLLWQLLPVQVEAGPVINS